MSKSSWTWSLNRKGDVKIRQCTYLKWVSPFLIKAAIRRSTRPKFLMVSHSVWNGCSLLSNRCKNYTRWHWTWRTCRGGFSPVLGGRDCWLSLTKQVWGGKATKGIGSPALEEILIQLPWSTPEQRRYGTSATLKCCPFLAGDWLMGWAGFCWGTELRWTKAGAPPSKTSKLELMWWTHTHTHIYISYKIMYVCM